MSLKAWLHHFDTNGDEKISYDEFVDGLRRMNFEGNVIELWNDIDEDGSGEITLDEIDTDAFDLWSSFRRWSALTFESSRDMFDKLSVGKEKRINVATFSG